MKWLQLISNTKSTYYKLITFLNQYGLSGLEEALQYFENANQYYFCNTRSSSSKIKIKELYYLKITEHKIKVYTATEIFEKYGTLNNELKFLSTYGFIKCHQSYIVSLEKIRTINRNKIILINEEILPLSNHYAPKDIVAFHNYNHNRKPSNP